MSAGIMPLFGLRWEQDKPAKAAKEEQPRFVTFRDESGFRFKLLDADGTQVLESSAFADPQACGRSIGAIKKAAVAGTPLTMVDRGDGAFDVLAYDDSPLAQGTDASRLARVMDALKLLAS